MASSDFSKAVYVSNIAPTANEKTVSDFFSFCGKITKLILKKSDAANGTHEVVVWFETESAAKTALLLTNALIVDRPISVVSYAKADGTPVVEWVAIEEQKNPGALHVPEPRDFSVPDEQRSKTSVVASLLAGGYSLGADAAQKAKEYDEKYGLTAPLYAGAEQVKQAVLAVNEQYKISETATGIANATTATISNTAQGIVNATKNIDAQLGISATTKSLDQTYGVSANLTYAGQAIADSAIAIKNAGVDLVSRVGQQPAVHSVTTAVTDAAHNVTATVVDINQQTQHQIAEHQKEKGTYNDAELSTPTPFVPSHPTNPASNV